MAASTMPVLKKNVAIFSWYSSQWLWVSATRTKASAATNFDSPVRWCSHQVLPDALGNGVIGPSQSALVYSFLSCFPHTLPTC